MKPFKNYLVKKSQRDAKRKMLDIVRTNLDNVWKSADFIAKKYDVKSIPFNTFSEIIKNATPKDEDKAMNEFTKAYADDLIRVKNKLISLAKNMKTDKVSVMLIKQELTEMYQQWESKFNNLITAPEKDGVKK